MTSYKESDAASAQDESKSALGCLIPLIAATVVLAIAITLVNSFVLDETNDADAPDAPADTASSPPPPDQRPAAAPPPSADAGSKTNNVLDFLEDLDSSAGISSEAILTVIRSLGWKEFGQPSVIDLGSEQRVTRKFRREGEQIEVSIHRHKSPEASRRVLEQTEPPARAIPFDQKVVVLDPLTAGARSMVDPLDERLRKFRDILQDNQDTR